jgi:alkylation response protein AidB-like acyl-CoA dehydrogenase
MGVDTDSFIDAALPIAMADPATAWSACFCAGHNRTLAHFPVEAQQEIWGGDYPYIAAPSLSSPPAQARRVHGGYRISGSWGWRSGIMDADWVLGVVMVIEEGAEPQLAMAAFPAADASVADTWNMDGLAASGSNDVAVADLFIPEHRMLTDFGIFGGNSVGAREHPEPVFHIPLTAFAGFIASVPILGAAKGVVDIITQLTLSPD